ncbi:hypothetical protein JWZ98_23035 (plasmid) [Methylomonas sp. EFPC1]|uniref:hypothetical protein n=1 Tax=Methylomonas sp. EFPC1 TaxID=2812647 RepID=UPI001967ED84|nr:hypothetical protein [Methylomonas sp. EFPC1]QSB03787.1 hypothetical protein JWZ98_23035 [Methylomonas sp. EFPC1]
MMPLHNKILNDPAASDWLKNALRAALVRDPVDAVNDAEILLNALNEQLHHALLQSA